MIRILRARDRVATRWKNGRGITHEVAVFPEGAGFDTFGWRVSIAEMTQGGPFSVFPGIDRHLAMLNGRIRLAIAGREAVELSPESKPAYFPGDAAAQAQILDGPATDLNVMVRREHFGARMTRHAQGDARIFDPNATATLIILLRETAVADFGLLLRGDAILAESGAGIALDTDYYCVEIHRRVDVMTPGSEKRGW